MCDGKTFFLVLGILLSIQACSSCSAGNPAASNSSNERGNVQRTSLDVVDAGLLPAAAPDRASIADSLFEIMKQVKEKRENRGVLNHTAPLRE